MDSAYQRQYREDARLLREVGAVLAEAEMPRFEVRLPRATAEKALAAWKRDDNDGPPEPETLEQRFQRRRAAALGLIALSIESAGHWEDDHVVVELSADLIGVAIDATDDRP
jgi:hypothetical protein